MLLTENAACAAAYAALAATSLAHSFIQNAYSEPLFTLKKFFDDGVGPEVLAVAVGTLSVVDNPGNLNRSRSNLYICSFKVILNWEFKLYSRSSVSLIKTM